jgi:hypothetical protein
MDQWRQNCLPHTARSLGHAVPALCREHVGSNDVLHGPCPFNLDGSEQGPLIVKEDGEEFYFLRTNPAALMLVGIGTRVNRTQRQEER